MGLCAQAPGLGLFEYRLFRSGAFVRAPGLGLWVQTSDLGLMVQASGTGLQEQASGL